MKKWTQPSGRAFRIYADMMQQPHLLVAGATGSGKSVVINGIITTALYFNPNQIQFILIDPKRVELAEYRQLPHVIGYASEPDTMPQALETALNIVESRFQAMQAAGLRMYQGSDIYVIIDELADLMTTQKRRVQPLLQRLAQIGRAARVHIIAATQCPLREVIPTAIKVNFDARVALRTRSAQDSRNILGHTGCETLPRYGQGYYMSPDGEQLRQIPMYTDQERQKLIEHYTGRRHWWRRSA